MNVAEMTYAPTSQEFSVDLAIGGLIAKIAAGTASDEERATLGQLSARRVRLMRRVVSGGKRAA